MFSGPKAWVWKKNMLQFSFSLAQYLLKFCDIDFPSEFFFILLP